MPSTLVVLLLLLDDELLLLLLLLLLLPRFNKLFLMVAITDGFFPLLSDVERGLGYYYDPMMNMSIIQEKIFVETK